LTPRTPRRKGLPQQAPRPPDRRFAPAAAVHSPGPGDSGGVPVPAETHVEGGSMDRQAVFELIRDRLADILEIEPGRITEAASFADDLDADSLALIELVEALEEKLRGPWGTGRGARRRPARPPTSDWSSSATPSSASSSPITCSVPTRACRRGS